MSKAKGWQKRGTREEERNENEIDRENEKERVRKNKAITHRSMFQCCRRSVALMGESSGCESNVSCQQADLCLLWPYHHQDGVYATGHFKECANIVCTMGQGTSAGKIQRCTEIKDVQIIFVLWALSISNPICYQLFQLDGIYEWEMDILLQQNCRRYTLSLMCSYSVKHFNMTVSHLISKWSIMDGTV